MPIGETIRELRRLRNITQTELAAAAGVSQGQLSRLESGETINPSQQTLLGIAEALHVTLTDLIGRPAVGTPDMPGRIPVPIVQVPAHAGEDWTWEPTGQSITTDERTSRGRQLQAIAIQGDCMTPNVEHGDVVVFDSWSRHPKDGDMVVVTLDNQIHIRWARLIRTGVQLLDNDGRELPTPGTILEGVVVEIRRQRPRRRDWHDLD